MVLRINSLPWTAHGRSFLRTWGTGLEGEALPMESHGVNEMFPFSFENERRPLET
jgi:hypothetical protein